MAKKNVFGTKIMIFVLKFLNFEKICLVDYRSEFEKGYKQCEMAEKHFSLKLKITQKFKRTKQKVSYRIK